MRLLRFAKILHVALKHGLDEFLLGHERFRWLRPAAHTLTFWRTLSSPRAVRLRVALQELGPIFVKFGQALSTRRDLLPTDIADELAMLQDRVPPFPTDEVVATLGRVYGRPVDSVFRVFERVPSASASVAQVHLAELPDGTPAAVKILRPNIIETIVKDLALMQVGAMLVEKLWSDGKRLKPREVVAEFERTIHDELDLAREAANCSQLRRNFLYSPLLLVPEVYWDWCTSEVMVMERMLGTPISQREAQTSATVRDGDAFVIGGLTQDDNLNTKTKVPLLGDIPIIGQAFRTDRYTKSKTELYIVVTPHIVHRVGATSVPANAPLYAPTTTTTLPIGPLAPPTPQLR